MSCSMSAMLLLCRITGAMAVTVGSSFARPLLSVWLHCLRHCVMLLLLTIASGTMESQTFMRKPLSVSKLALCLSFGACQALFWQTTGAISVDSAEICASACDLMAQSLLGHTAGFCRHPQDGGLGLSGQVHGCGSGYCGPGRHSGDSVPLRN